MPRLNMGDAPIRKFSLMHNPRQKERLENLYDFEFGENEETFEKHREESERLENREVESWKSVWNTIIHSS